LGDRPLPTLLGRLSAHACHAAAKLAVVKRIAQAGP